MPTPLQKRKLMGEINVVPYIDVMLVLLVIFMVTAPLLTQGIEVDLLDMRTIRPLDLDAVLESLQKTNRIVVVDQSWPFGSPASELITQVIEHGFDLLDAEPARVNTADVPTPYAKGLEAEYLPNPRRIIEAVKKTLD